MNDSKIYFDNGSTSFPKAPKVGEVIAQLLTEGAFNINRGSYENAYALESMVFNTRQLLCDMFGGKSARQVIFAPNITFALNYVIKGWLKSGDHVIASSMEHNAVMRPLQQVAKNGVTFDLAQADAQGVLDPQKIEDLIKPNTKGVIITAASNVCGTHMPLAQIGEICKRRNIRFVVDSAQLAGTFPLSVQRLGIDVLAFTGHKGLLGPQGIGGMVISEEMAEEIDPLVSGGTGSVSDLEEMPNYLPDKFEPGTQNLPGIVGLHTALAYHNSLEPLAIANAELAVTKRFLSGAMALPYTEVIGLPHMKNRSAIVSLDFPEHDNAEIAFLLEDKYKIMTRCGLHCAPRAHKTLGTFPQGTVRFSFGYKNTFDEVDAGLLALQQILGGNK